MYLLLAWGKMEIIDYLFGCRQWENGNYSFLFAVHCRQNIFLFVFDIHYLPFAGGKKEMCPQRQHRGVCNSTLQLSC